MPDLLANSFTWTLPIIVAWTAVCLCVAVYCCRVLDASRNPIEWLPFFLLGPVIFAFASVTVALLVPLGFLLCLIGLILLPFGKTVKSTSDGLVLARRFGRAEELLRWSEIKEWTTIETYPCDTHAVRMRTGEKICLPSLNIQDVIPYLTAHDIPIATEAM